VPVITAIGACETIICWRVLLNNPPYRYRQALIGRCLGRKKRWPAASSKAMFGVVVAQETSAITSSHLIWRALNPAFRCGMIVDRDRDCLRNQTHNALRMPVNTRRIASGK
jgi:hypothetical protein